ncbi:MAG: sigma-70 family RNA polymerase sigma factor [Planctomycetes bacterium]|nr:sigma-70 family RNA polymerase sigma factor [Planctomycetota bacterium]
MSGTDSTCWTMIEAAATGAAGAREQFARSYAPVVRAYLAARWAGSPCLPDLDDAVQEVFVECLKSGGVLDRADPARAGGFRAFLYGAIRNVARRAEEGQAAGREGPFPSRCDPEQIPARERSLSSIFDRAWARAVTREAAARLAERAAERGGEAERRAELLRLRYQEGLEIAEIARRWQAEPDSLHPKFTRARREFRRELLEVLRFHHPESPARIRQEYAELLALL